MTVEDAYAVQALWAGRRQAAGRRIVGRKIGLTSKVMQRATGIDEPDYGVIFDDMVYQSGDEIPVDVVRQGARRSRVGLRRSRGRCPERV